MLLARRPRRSLPALAALGMMTPLAWGCAGPDGAEPLAEAPGAAPAIYGGDEVAPGAWDAVVAIFDDGVLCTGTLVSPRVVLTAGHCLADLEAGELPEVYFGDGLVEGQTLAVARYGIHPDFCRSCKEDVNDFGFVELAADRTPSGGFPAPIADQAAWDAAMAEGASLTLVGYGESDDAPADPFLGAGVKREVETTLTTLGDTGLEFLAGGEGKSTCQGDSGGPAFAPADGGGYRLAGVLARGECGEASFYGAPYAALCWLRDEAGADLVPAGCEGCDCLDTAPSGCDCGVPAAPAEAAAEPALAALVGLGLVCRARARRRASRPR